MPVRNIDQTEYIKKNDEYWKQVLTKLPPPLELPVGHPSKSPGLYECARVTFRISELCSRALKQLSLQCQTTLFITLLAAFKTLLYRYTNQSDIIVASPVAENGKITEGLLNMLLPLRTDLSEDPTFYTLLSRECEVVSAAYKDKDLISPILPDMLMLEKGGSTASLFQVIFALRSIDDSSLKADDSGNINKADSLSASPDLALYLDELPQGLTGVFDYNKYLFDDAEIGRIVKHFHVLLDGIVSHPEQNISCLPILTLEERQRVIVDWNDTYVEYPDSKCIHELFEQQVDLTPHAVAVKLYQVTDKDAAGITTAVSYDELNKRSNKLAHYLRSLGVGPEVLVAIAAERSLEMVVGILAILKAGGAYLPLDPSYPKERLDFMLGDSQVSVLLTQARLVKELPPHQAKIVCLDSDWTNIEKHSPENVRSSVNATNLAYVIYTSGSTGKPKGTLIIHSGVVNYLRWCVKEYAVADGQGAPINSSIAFDATVTSFFSPLLTGKTIWLIPEKGEIEALTKVLLEKNHFSLVKITPAHLQILSHMLPVHQMEGQTNALIIGGETLPRKSLEIWIKQAPHTRLINEYGPTETVVGCCVYEATGQHLSTNDVPIGRPIANTQMYLLDQNMQPVPVGVAGEIYIGGAGVARGYLNRPDLTIERFVNNPFNDDITSRLYKTGDLARYLADGTIMFLGRIDHQVKIRGYRIELGEIESTLSQHPFIQQVAVIVREDAPGNKRLVTYFVTHDDNKVTTGNLRRFLSEKLPEYMIPAVFINLKAFPLTANGKINRSALPVPDQHRPELEKAFLAPRDVTEIKLTKIFEECLKIHPIGIYDNFFDLGADSLQAAYILVRIKKTFGKQFQLAVLLEAPTIEELAILIRKKDKPAPWSAMVPIQPLGSKLPLFCIHGGAGTVLFYKDLAKHLGPDQPFYGLQAKGLNGIGMPHTSIEEMATHYINEIRSLQPEGPYYLGGYCFGGVIAFEIAKQLTAQGHQIALLANFNAVSSVYVAPANSPVIETEIKPDEAPKAFLTRISDLWNNTQLPGVQAKLVFFSKVLKKKINAQVQWKLLKIQWKMLLLIYKVYFTFKIPLPAAVARYYLYRTNSNIVNAYRPAPYRGRMVIFRSPDIYPDPHLGWTSLIDGCIETCDIPGDHQQDRRQIMNEPFVLILAKELTNYIHEQHKPANVSLRKELPVKV